MKKQTFTKLLLPVMAMLFLTNAKAQDVEENPLDTLTRHVAAIRSELDVLKRIKISGYIHAEYQVADSGGAATYAAGNFPAGTDKRFIIRRGRVKVQYESPINENGWSTSLYVFNFDVSQVGLSIRDLYARMTDPWTGWFSLTAGMQNRPFGFEVPYSSGQRESPERGRMSQILFPNERDLGAMVTIQGPKVSNWSWLKLEAGFFNGTGGPSAGVNASDFDKYKDFIGHLSISRSTANEKMKWGLGASYYNGGYRQDTVSSYNFGIDSLGVKGFIVDLKKSDVSPNINTRSEVKREYTGFDGQLNISWIAGITILRAEYIQGVQPGVSGSSTSPVAVVTGDIYKRHFNGAYFYFVQSIAQSRWQTILKYDWYDPNTDVKGDEVGKKVGQKLNAKTTNGSDIKYTTLGMGIAYRWDANVLLTAYYDKVTNETSANLAGYTNDLKDNVLTLRMQVRF